MADMIAGVPEFLLVVPMVKTIVLLVLLLPWLAAAPWVNKDVRKISHPSAALWNGVVLGAGALGVAAWLAIPFYLLGLLFYLILASGGMVAYITWRNGRVPAEQKVLTRQHLLKGLKRRKRRRRRQMEILTKVVIYDPHEKMVYPPDMTTAEDAEIDTYNKVQEFLYDTLWRRASEVAVVPAGQQARVAYVIDGMAAERPAVPLADSEAVIQFLKEVSGMEAEERRRPQKGAVSVDFQGARADMHLSSAGTTGGQRLVMRILQEVARTRLEELGMPDDILGRVHGITQTENGLFIVSGRPGSGVTSTLYSILRERDAYTQDVATVEASKSVDLENITQHLYGDDAKLPETLTEVVQKGANVLMVDHCPNAETAKLIAQAAAKIPVLLGMRANDSFTALAKWVQLCGDATVAARILRGVMCQMLLRKLCTECREAYRPDPQRLAKLNLPADQIENFYRPPGEEEAGRAGLVEPCSSCQGSGYKSRAAVFELLMLTKEIRQLIMDGATVGQIRAACRKNKMLYLQEQAMRRVIDGTTSIPEVIRITQQQQGQPKKG